MNITYGTYLGYKRTFYGGVFYQRVVTISYVGFWRNKGPYHLNRKKSHEFWSHHDHKSHGFQKLNIFCSKRTAKNNHREKSFEFTHPWSLLARFWYTIQDLSEILIAKSIQWTGHMWLTSCYKWILIAFIANENGLHQHLSHHFTILSMRPAY